jgi:hypothetical protein
MLPREATAGKSTDALPANTTVGRHECPHCHEFADYATEDLIPGTGRIQSSRTVE